MLLRPAYIHECDPRPMARTTPAPTNSRLSPASTVSDCSRMGGTSISSCPTPRWAPWPSGPSSTAGAASPSPTGPTQRIAAAMNPAMSSWVALRRRIHFEPGRSVLILGATGIAGRLAIQVARQLGAGRVIAAGRNRLLRDTLPDLGADVVVGLDGEPGDVSSKLGDAAQDVDIVLDYLWGEPAAQAMTGIVTQRTDRGRALTWIQIGSVAGPAASVPSAALRAANLQIVGSGQGSVAAADILAELPELAIRISDGTVTVDAVGLPLSRVEAAWTEPTTPGQRVVLCPDLDAPTIQAR